jgi:hypothetical protein
VSQPPSPEQSSDRPVANIAEEARRLLSEARARSLPLRLIGGIAIRLHATGEPPPALTREFKDIDLVTSRARSRDVTNLIVSLGYTPDNRFNTLNSGRRALFYDVPHERQLDLFVGSFEMCHKIPVADRLDADPDTVPLAELLLTKLQIVELNEKDLRDTLALVVDHEIADHDADAINGTRIAELCADDWGLWRTCKQNIERARTSVGGFGLSDAEAAVIDERMQALWQRIEAEPKSRRWRLRDRVGDRVRWYEMPEEVT